MLVCDHSVFVCKDREQQCDNGGNWCVMLEDSQQIGPFTLHQITLHLCLIEVNKHHDPIPALVFFLHKTKDMGLPAMFYFMFRGAHQLHLESGCIRFCEIDLLLSWLLKCVLSRMTQLLLAYHLKV